MTHKYKIIKFAIFLMIGLVTGTLFAQTLIPVNVTGFNHDIIAEGAGGMNRAAATTSITFDVPTAGGNNVFYSKDFRGNNNPTTAPPYGLPDNRIINSVATPGVSYQLARYDMNNALVLKGIGSSGTLTLETSGVFSIITLLSTSAELSSSINVICNFSDGTNFTKLLTVPQWISGTGDVAIKGMGVVTRTQVGTEAPDIFKCDAGCPTLFDIAFILDAPFSSKILTSITFQKVSETGSTAMFAVVGITAPGAPAAPVATATTNQTFTTFTANWQVASGATAYFLDVSTSPTFSTLLPNYNNRDVGNVLSFNVTGLPNAPVYYYRVRARNISGVSLSSNTINVSTVSSTPVVLSGFNHDIIAEGVGGVNRAAATTSITFDSIFMAGGTVFYSKDFRGNNNQNSAPPLGLPVNRIINSVDNPGVSYQLAPYNMKNALVLRNLGSSGTLTLETPGIFSSFSMLGTCAGGPCDLNVIYNFSDGTNFTKVLNIADWDSGTGDVAIEGMGVVTRTQIINLPPDDFDEDSEVYKLYDNLIEFPAPWNSKILNSITFQKQTGSGSAAVFAMADFSKCNATNSPVIEFRQIGSLCLGNSLRILASGGDTYTWSGPNNFSASGGLIILRGGEAVPGRYVLTATNAEGCSSTATIDVKTIYRIPETDIVLLENNFLVGGRACVGDTLRFIDYGQVYDIPDSIPFVWDFGNGITSTERDPLYQYPETGLFDVSLTIDYARCVLRVEKTVEIVACRIGITGNQFAKIYPTPNNGEVNLELTLPNPGDILVKIYNANGQQILTKSYRNIEDINEKIDINENGVFFIEIYHDYGIERHRTIVIH